MSKKEKVEYAAAGSAEYVRGMWSKAIQQYLSYISDDTGISMEDLLMKCRAELSTDEGITGLIFNVTDDNAYEMFVFKGGEGEDDPINATIADVNVVAKLLKGAREDVGKAA